MRNSESGPFLRRLHSAPCLSDYPEEMLTFVTEAFQEPAGCPKTCPLREDQLGGRYLFQGPKKKKTSVCGQNPTPANCPLHSKVGIAEGRTSSTREELIRKKKGGRDAGGPINALTSGEKRTVFEYQHILLYKNPRKINPFQGPPQGALLTPATAGLSKRQGGSRTAARIQVPA